MATMTSSEPDQLNHRPPIDQAIEPALTPAQPSAREDRPLAGFDSVPLFMTSLPPDQGGRAGAMPENNHVLDALQSLMYEGPPSEVAAGLKAQANDLFAEQKYREALGFYTRAIDECGQELDISERRILWSNRAATNLELRNYGATLRDISLVLSAPLPSAEPTSVRWNTTTLKALLRSARALMALNKLPEALDALVRLRLLETSMGTEAADVGRTFRVQVEQKLEAIHKKERESAERTRRAKESEKRIGEALVLRGAILPRRLPSQSLFHACPTDITPPHFDPDALPPGNRLTLPLGPSTSSSEPFIVWEAPPPSLPLLIPVFILLPLADPPTRDLCLAFHTNSTFGEELDAMDHDPATFDLYFATNQGRVLKVGAKLELGKVMAAAGKKPGEGWELKEGWALELIAVPKGPKGEEWIAGWKEKLQLGVAI